MANSHPRYQWIVQGASSLNIVVGLLLLVSPVLMGFPAGSRATTVSVALGALVMTWAVVRVLIAWDAPVWSWLNVVIGLCLLLGAYRLGRYAGLEPVNLLAAGVAVVVLASISALSTHLRRRLH